MKRVSKWFISMPILMTSSVLFFSLPLKVKAEWEIVGSDNKLNSPIYIENESVRIKGDVRSGKVDHVNFGRALFVINCRTDSYYLQSNNGNREEGLALPGTIAGVLAQEICDEYFL